MANVLVVVDPDAERRTAFCKAVRPHLAPVDGLVAGACASRDFHALWAAGARAPVSFWAGEQGTAVVWGRALGEDGRPVEARQLPDIWADIASGRPEAFDGYHAAACWDARQGLVLGADLLGMYPLYWWQGGGVLLAGSSPEPFRLHPAFRWTLDPGGLAGILLTMHSVGGRTLMQGVRRLGAGHLLVVPQGAAAREVAQFRLPVSTDHFDLPFASAVELLHETVVQAVARHVPAGEPLTIALSGGRDSRQLAGAMAALGRSAVALTFGDERDIGMGCARAVARSLGLAHHLRPVAVDRHDRRAKLHARWLHCTTGFNSIAYWDVQDELRALPPLLVCGYAMDSIVGGSHMGWCLGPDGRTPSFAQFFRRINQSGVELEILRRLLRRDLFGDALDEVMDELGRSYAGYSPFETQRAWGFDLHHRQRFHIGNPPWLLSFGAWPVLPAIDREVLKVAGGLPAAALADRRAQDEIIRTRFPALAELPLERNRYDTTPLSPRLRDRVAKTLLARVTPRRRPRPKAAEQRFYHRMYDFDGPGWKAARRAAEPFRERLHALFEKDALDAYLPPPETDLRLGEGLAEASGRKLILGLCYWAGEYL